MIVKVPKKWDSQRLREIMKDFLFNFRGEEKGYLVFEGNFGMGVSKDQLSMGAREFREFAKDLAIEGGSKNVERNWLFVRLHQTKRVHLRFPAEHYELLKKYAKKFKMTPSTMIRDAIGEKLFRLESARKSKKEEREYA
jgi:hypothetical protein